MEPARVGPTATAVTVMCSATSRATVFPSALSSRMTLTVLVALTMGSSALRLIGLRRAVGPAEQQPTTPPGLLELEHQPGSVQPPVEGIQPGTPTGARHAGFRGHGERLRQRVEHGGQEILPGFIPDRCLKDEVQQARRHSVTLSS